MIFTLICSSNLVHICAVSDFALISTVTKCNIFAQINLGRGGVYLQILRDGIARWVLNFDIMV